MWFQTEEEEGIRTNLHNPWRSRQKTLKLRRWKAAKHMQIKGPTKKIDRRRKWKTEVREQRTKTRWDPANPRPLPNRELF